MDHSLAVIMDVVRRYDIDGVHFDDYFYPYPIDDKDGNPIDFPDEASWAKYLEGLHGQPPLARDDWRRANVNQLLERLSTEIHQAKPWVRFGVSPFGIYRPGHPPDIKGFDSYAKLYADSLKWFQDGTVDYFSPQLYWPIEQKAQSYPVLLEWWSEQNTHGRNLWPGNFTSRVDDGSKTEWAADEVVRQIEATRAQDGASGNIHFSIKAVAADRGGVATKLREGVYAKPALVPASPWLAAKTPPPKHARAIVGRAGGQTQALAAAAGWEAALAMDSRHGTRRRLDDEDRAGSYSSDERLHRPQGRGLGRQSHRDRRAQRRRSR